MKKIIYHLLLVVLLLSGCNVRELTFDRAYPNQEVLNEMREKRQEEIEEEIRNLPNKIMTEKQKPRMLVIIEKNKDNNMRMLEVSQYCWDYNYLDCERMTPIHPDNRLNYYLQNFTIPTNREIEVYADKNRRNLPLPFRIELYLFDQNKNLNLYQAIESETESFYFTSPSEPGIYTVLFKVFYDWEIDGIAYHPMQIYVR